MHVGRVGVRGTRKFFNSRNVRLATSTNAQAVAPAATVQKWEYKAISVEDLLNLSNPKWQSAENNSLYWSYIEKGLNELGKNGWELAATPTANGTIYSFCFKRSVPPQK